MTQTIFWDLDGTLINSAAVHQCSMLAACEVAGLALQTTAEPSAGLDGAATFRWFTGIDAELQPHLYQMWYQATIHYVLDHLAECQPISWACRWVTQLAEAGVPQWLVTNSDLQLARAALQHLALNHCFAGIISRDQVQQGKPAAEPYLLALQRSGCAPDSALAIEDSLSGLIAARAAGVKVLAVTAIPELSADFTLPAGMTATQEKALFHVLFGSSLPDSLKDNPDLIAIGNA